MRHKFLYVPMFFFLLAVETMAVDLSLTIEQVKPLTANTFSFDIYLKNNSDTPLEYANGQYAILCDPRINGGTLTMAEVTSDISSSLLPRNPVVNSSFSENSSSYLKFQWAANACPLAGNGKSVAGGQKIKIMTILVTGTEPFNALNPQLSFYTGTSGLATKINAYITSLNTNVSGGVTFTGENDNTVLPVELKTFTADVNSTSSRDVTLRWYTATEINVNHFEVERAEVSTSTTEKTWTLIDKKTAAGNSNSPQTYSSVDRKLNAGTYAYRLRIINNDGTAEISKIEATAQVLSPKSFDLSQNYPNPFNPSTKIDYQIPAQARVVLELYNVRGQKVATLFDEQEAAGYYTYTFTTGNGQTSLTSGIYFLRLVTKANDGPTFSSVKKLVYVK